MILIRTEWLAESGCRWDICVSLPMLFTKLSIKISWTDWWCWPIKIMEVSYRWPMGGTLYICSGHLVQASPIMLQFYWEHIQTTGWIWKSIFHQTDDLYSTLWKSCITQGFNIWTILICQGVACSHCQGKFEPKLKDSTQFWLWAGTTSGGRQQLMLYRSPLCSILNPWIMSRSSSLTWTIHCITSLLTIMIQLMSL